jgi:hypothetical protein
LHVGVELADMWIVFTDDSETPARHSSVIGVNHLISRVLLTI